MIVEKEEAHIRANLFIVQPSRQSALNSYKHMLYTDSN
jgi:hypothetical protein